MCGHHGQHHHRARWEPAAALPADDVRASDAERETTIADLRTHAGDGRLTAEELDERVGRAYAAATRRQLAALLTDLPRRPRPRATTGAGDGFAEHLRSYVLVMVLLVGIWALTGADYFWPMWPALGWGLGLLSHRAGCAGGRRGAHGGPPADLLRPSAPGGR